MASQTDYERMFLGEVEHWPEVTCVFESGSKHKRVVFSWRGATRFLMYPSSPGGGRHGMRNKLGEVRRVLAELGATRAPRQRQRGARGKPAPRKPQKLPAGEAAPIIDHWSKLGPLLRKMRPES